MVEMLLHAGNVDIFYLFLTNFVTALLALLIKFDCNWLVVLNDLVLPFFPLS